MCTVAIPLLRSLALEEHRKDGVCRVHGIRGLRCFVRVRNTKATWDTDGNVELGRMG